MKKSRAEENEKYWKTHIEEHRKIGLSQREYCEQKGISFWSFNPWKRKIEKEKSKLQEIPPSLVQSLSSGNREIEVILEGRIRISIPDNFSEETLKKVLNVLVACK